jgi:hypothetical protein
MKASNLLCIVLVITLGLFIMAQFSQTRSYAPRMSGGAARLPCLANNHCPMGQKCASGFCSEGFITPPSQIADMSSCTAKECNGLNAPCARKGVPCPEGTFCQGNNCIRIAAPDQGAAYNQIGMLLD